MMSNMPLVIYTQIEECWLITGGGIHVKLEPSLDGPTAIHATYMPRHTERTMHTRSSNDRRQRTMQEVTVQYNLVNEPWHKYSISNIAGGLDGDWVDKDVYSHATHTPMWFCHRSWIETSSMDKCKALEACTVV